MIKVVTMDEMRGIEQAADAGGLSYDEMMANAGASVASILLDYWPDLRDANVLVLVGPGNNGGDGLVAAHHLREAGARIELYLSHLRSPSDDHNFARLNQDDVKVTLVDDDSRGTILTNAIRNADLVIDALLGTGIKLPLRGTPEKILSTANKALQELDEQPSVAAVDCPSGLDCDTGQISALSLKADLTVTLAAAKPGLFEFPGAAVVGKLEVGSIGLPPDFPELEAVNHVLALPGDLRAWLPTRPLNAHKGTFGRVLIVAGSINYPGAAALSGMGAYRTGAGLVTLAVPAAVQSLLVPYLPEATWISLPQEMGVIAKPAAKVLHREMKSVDALLIGPGFGRETSTRDFLEQLLALGQDNKKHRDIGFVKEGNEHVQIALPPCVVDADGLKLLSSLENWSSAFSATAILTPHPGEFAIMTGLSIDDILADRAKYALQFAEIWGHVLVLKGAFTLIAAPGGRMATIPIATPALASAGTGDVLAGAIVSLRAQGMDAFEAAVLGAYIHARAGELAAEDMGTTVSVVAGDVIEFLPAVFAEIAVK